MSETARTMAVMGVIALLLVSSIASPFGTQTASAAEGDELGEQAGEAACSASAPLQLLLSECNVEYGDVDGSTADQVHYDIYSDSVFMQDSRRQTITEKRSYLNQTHGIAMARAKQTLVKCMNNGTAKSVCQDKARQDVDEFYAEVQKSLYISQNRQMQHWKLMEQQRNQTDNLGMSVYPYETNENDWETGFRQVNLTLYNGENVTVTKGYYRYVGGDGGDTYYNYPYYYNGENLGNQGDSFGSQVNENTSLNVISPDAETSIALEGQNYADALTTVDRQRSRSMDNINSLADSIYNQYDPGDISYTDTAGPLEMMITSSSDYGSTGYYSYLLETAAEAGLAVPDAASMTVEHDFDGDGTLETKRGAIFAQDGTFSNNNTIQTGVTYDPANLPNAVNFVIADDGGKAEQVRLDKNFTVVSMENPKTDESINNTTLQSTDFQTTDTDNLNRQVTDLEQKLEDLEESYDAPSTGFSLGGSGITDGLQSFLQEFGILAVVFGAIAVLIIIKL